MNTHHAGATIHETPQDVVALLAHRPNHWLGAFLILAVRSVPRDEASVQLGRPRYWVGPAETEDASGVLSIPFVWRPHGDAELFERFRGRLRVAPRTSGCQLDVDGVAEGGRADRNAQVLRNLVDMLGGAIEADQDSDE